MQFSRSICRYLGLLINRCKSIFVGFGLCQDGEIPCPKASGVPIGSLAM